ncbi:tryptophan 7-halogenase [Massilia sp. PAMC28688]|uniref:tryptophan halogenase family protein n=1 Tax=Massilia sp. PAMC28688 TaxID=2861283 RepID=UPI001C62A05B|nr:tryptophan halogenase family protein [Massilia sp. PAMC28688]QYF92766.1 tryptophan 7-halogenase [Massilia sp. PAMC28688]
MALEPVRRIVIAGGGTAGWMTAAALSKLLGPACRIELVESEDIGTIGVGEATIPHINEFNQALGIDEDAFVRATQGTFKLGIEFVNWGAVGERFIHGFGRVGQPGDALPFHHFWLRMAALGKASKLEAYSMNTAAPRAGKFMRARPEMAGSPMQDLVHAFHFDAGLYARFLRSHAENMGVVRTEGKIEQVLQREPDGFIEALVMQNGARIEGDFFIDCSGMRGILIEQTLKSGYEDWSHWLPCDRAIAVPCESAGPLLPLTRSTAHAAGWQWRIPLQHRTGNGHVYSSGFMEQDQATGILMDNLDGAALAEPRHLRFQTGRRKRFWNRNCIAVGLSSGFLEPLESTSIHLIQTAISRIASFFPHGGFDPVDIAEYNRQTNVEYEFIRDFLILHYKVTRRDDSEFWRYCSNMAIPDSLQRKIDLFSSSGRIYREQDELFTEMSWLQVMIGQGVMPRAYHPFAQLRPEAEVHAYLNNVEQVIARCVHAMPTQADFIAAHCKAGTNPER